jgi:hypothetical protein
MDSYTNKDDVASATQPDSLWSMGDYSYLQVPQSTYPDPGLYVPGFNTADDAGLLFAPTAEMGAFTNLSAGVNFTNQVSIQCTGTPTWTYPAVPQNVLDPWSMPGPCMFLSCICHDPSYSPDTNPKPSTSTPPMMRPFHLPPLQRWAR